MAASKSRGPARPRLPWPAVDFKPARFIAANPVFRFEEFVAAHAEADPKTIEQILGYHVKQGLLNSVRRGVYAQPGNTNRWLIASRLAADAVIAYGGALTFHHIGHDTSEIVFITEKRPPAVFYSQTQYRPVAPPSKVSGLPDSMGEITEEYRQGLKLRVTTPERTLVDLLDRLDLAPPPRQLWDCFRLVDLKPLRMIQYARRLGSKLVAARLGYFLEHRGATDSQLGLLEKLRPAAPCYFASAAGLARNRYFHRWNLVVPHKLWHYVDTDANPPRDPVERMIRDWKHPELEDRNDDEGW